MTDSPMLAAAQAAPVYFDREASTEKACALIEEAGRNGAEVVAFGESWLPGYPFFAWRKHGALRWEAAEAYVAQAVTIPGPETDRLCEAAAAAGTDVVIGVAELDPRSLGTVYCSLLTIGREGVVLGRHRKLKPTMNERTVWGEGSGDDLNVYQRPYGRLSGLNCWEHQMVLAGYALMAQGAQIHVAAWPGEDPEEIPAPPDPLWARQELLSRAFAAQGSCYVIAAAGMLRLEDVPERFRSLAYPGPGDSFVVDPRGEIVARAPRGEEAILYHQAELAHVRAAKVAGDVAGHYSRPDVLQLLVRGTPAGEVMPIPEPDGDAPD